MLRSLKGLHGNVVLASDGEIGKVYDFYFEDHTWVVRYLVADTGQWWPDRKVLITASALGKPSRARNWARPNVCVFLTREQVRKSPDIDTAKPVSRQQQEQLHKNFGWPFDWIEPRSSKSRQPVSPGSGLRATQRLPSNQGNFDPHLRSAREVEGYRVHAIDGDLGHIADFIEDDAGWVIRYIVVATSNWLPAKKVLIPPQWLTKITLTKRTVSVDLRQENVLNCPEFHPTAGVNREYEEVLYDYYGRPTYWNETDTLSKTRR